MWDLNIEVTGYSHGSRRGAFLYHEETYDSWLWMALDRGRFSFQLGKGPGKSSGECGPGDWILCPPGQLYRRELLQDLSFHFVRFQCHSSETLLALAGRGTLQDGQYLRSRLHSLPPAMKEPEGLQWVSHVLRDLLTTQLWEQRTRQVRSEELDPVMEQCRQYLDAHTKDDVDLAHLASRYRMAGSIFSRRFKAAYGIPPSQYLMERRLADARSMLLETTLSQDAIARSTGFGSGLYLSRVWRQKYGDTPGRYRRQHRV